MDAERLIERTEIRRQAVSDALRSEHRAEWGQFFTPPEVAAFLAELIDLPDRGTLKILDPGAGIGSLTAAVVARAVQEEPGCAIHLVAFEADPALSRPLGKTLRDCELTARDAGVALTTEARETDFLEWAGAALGGSFLATPETFGACVMNPPYRKINNGTAHRAALERLGLRVTNLYTAFMGVAAALLDPGGQLSAITARSFANGSYFLPFREFFLSRMALDRLHVYESRGAVFADTDVLQENVVLRATRDGSRDSVLISTSTGNGDAPATRLVPYGEVIHPADRQAYVRIPIDEYATRVACSVADLPASLPDLGIQVSTGRVVDFRSREHLSRDPAVGCAPLIYPVHLSQRGVDWPRLGGKKPNALRANPETASLFLPAGHYVLVKRFSSKEQRRRVSASWFRTESVPGEQVAFENHLNVFHRSGEGVEPDLAAGLTIYLNTSTVDSFVRHFSGHTQINATDLRQLRYPDLDTLQALGAAARKRGFPLDQNETDSLAQTLIPSLHAAEPVMQAA